MKAPGTSSRLRFAVIHLGASLLVALIASVLVFAVWYPAPYADLAGGARLFLLMVAVDVTLGPALTAVAASPGKPRQELFRDLAVIVALQLSAFAYGLHATAIARPVALVFEVDLFRIVSAVEIDATEQAQAPAGLRDLSWTGPRTLAVTKPTDLAELTRSIELGFSGVPLAALARYWRAYETQADAVWRVAQPAAALLARQPDLAPRLNLLATQAGVAADQLRSLPVVGRHGSATAIVAQPGAKIVGFLPAPPGR